MENEGDSISTNDTARPWQSYHTVYTNAKAGMEGVDKEKVQRVVYEMSKGSKYFENEERKEAYTKQKIENMRVQLAKLTPPDIDNYQKIADERLVDLEATRDLSRIWLHVDMDAFYAAVETLSNPSLEGKPMAVGSLSMISTANYEARKFGVRAAMPGFIARKLCPELIFVPTDFKKYTYYSDLTRKVFQKYDPNFFAASLDEAYLDITNFCSDMGLTGGQVAEELRESVHNETGLTCSAGVAPNRLLAKVCSDINKPDGQFLLPNNRMAVMTFISSLPIRKIGGIGKVTENILKDVLGITTCEDMLQKSGFIFALFSRSSAGLGLGRTDTPQSRCRKSMSTERTFPSTKDETTLCQKLVDLAENLSADLKKEGLCGKTLTLKLKTSSFEVRTRAVTLPRYIFSIEDILKHAMMLLKAELPASLRLMGLRMSQFSEDGKCDRTQKTLSSFIVTDDALGRALGDQKLSQSYLEGDTSSIGRGTSFSNDTSSCESMDLAHVHQVQSDSRKRRVVVVEGEESFDLRIDRSRKNDDDLSTENGAIEMVPIFAERDSSSMKNEESSLERPRRVIGCSDDEPVSLHEKEPLVWLNGYRCSVCGIELPPSFIDERQEHFDFHLAERLQKEESSDALRIPKHSKRLVQEDHKVIHCRQKKKPKASPSKVPHQFCEMQSMRIAYLPNNPISPYPLQNPRVHIKYCDQFEPPNQTRTRNRRKSSPTQNSYQITKNHEIELPTMSEIMDASRAQNLDIELRTFGPFFRITATSLATNRDLGRLEGVIRAWFRGKILHLDSMKLRKETIKMEKSLFGIGLFIGAIAIRHGYERGCSTAELLAINDSDLYHSKVIFLTLPTQNFEFYF
ncbi:DNA polymerase kappa [Dorcoceras hygrometricum]|uniref:DNA polymerase kappa n=1 Tax=Dorcoceras hygrometricum TaxID=472368 RepID=A0A2Z7CX45_9LAMI|nr:DNA polymerase kappa [Dorcoceras hygrometricum]